MSVTHLIGLLFALGGSADCRHGIFAIAIGCARLLLTEPGARLFAVKFAAGGGAGEHNHQHQHAERDPRREPDE
ncbi:hypothetical protein [Sphingomonas sp.]|uniref:hypothetical protein n=1 Tax=Sphingomonas sp. TaxID=28214 RepID=UPI00286CABDD|nr:hypothetical protein [Sphingomonas sp.]